jgi:ketosteroid isomerase-like protein
MSQENVEIARAAFDAWTREDYDAFLALWGEEGEFYPLRAQLEGRAYHGRDGVRRFIAEFGEEFEDIRFDLDHIRETEDKLVGLGRFRTRGRASGVEVDAAMGFIGIVRDARIVYARFFSDPTEALEAAGLRE